MATSTFKATNYSAEEFVESCGAILFDFSGPAPQVGLVYYKPKDEWLLAKGRRNCGESRHAATLREIEEETGYRCHLFPITMPTRAPASAEKSSVPDQPRLYPDLTEPFMVTVREVDGKANVKIIWWYIAEVTSTDRASGGEGEEAFTSQFFNTEDAIQKLTFCSDRQILKKAIDLTEEQAYEGSRILNPDGRQK
ncbi:uncharacterized protein F5Z01DRAFT_326147 [Emericellopsis atlantica]|uniref:Nudix hydrolase domain-containing protein n=1 Tax=Emericellopsis atlantica TaxID=2614577 RepID=A0A9P7ZUY5_9HYPO|nr:uncharacterized protein F5Z01DRAFT_326147 [Emericellopsis atlantica]KAG9258227.1 hypothetical protein F5Z01DRAFT_326147 [Emericellopsis atlantica]